MIAKDPQAVAVARCNHRSQLDMPAACGDKWEGPHDGLAQVVLQASDEALCARRTLKITGETIFGQS